MLNEQNKYARDILLISYCSQKLCQQYTLLTFGSSQRPRQSEKSNTAFKVKDWNVRQLNPRQGLYKRYES